MSVIDVKGEQTVDFERWWTQNLNPRKITVVN